MLQKKSNIRLLIIDDELGFYQSFRAQHQAIYAFEAVKEIERGMGLIGSFKPDAILLDLKFKGKSSHEQGVNTILPQVIHKLQNKCPVIVVTSAREKHIYNRALENGAWACLQKIDYDGTVWHQKILDTVAAFRDHQNTNHFDSKKTTNHTSTSQDGFIALTSVMQALKSRLKTLGEKYAHVPVLILGETGVGKEVAARYLHSVKTNATKLPFETVNLGAYSEELLFSEIFGHKKGSFTNAVDDKTGAFEKAKKGTLFLDEIGEVSLRTQISLLNVLNDRTFRRVGSTDDVALDVHLVFATNRDLEQAISTGGFREDFYHRISDYTIQIPPLRERKAEILPLIEYYLTQLCKANNHPLYQKEAQEAFSPAALEALLQYYWPGNIRELRKTIQNLIIEVDVWGKKQIEESILPQRFLQKRLFPIPIIEEVRSTPIIEFGSTFLSQPQILDVNWPIAKQTAFSELSIIEKVLRESGGRKDDAAKAVGLKNDQNLRYKVLKYYKDYSDFFDNFPIVCKLYKL